MNQTLQMLYSPETYQKITNSHILMIGVGGIGCELLKVLTNSGYRKMTILDLDTIEATNLNRQFYFRKEHVGMSKALVGKESVMRKHPDLDITAIHGSIFEAKFDVEFYSQFDLVFCALDNAQAREHLGRMCLKSNKILVDAGTGGFGGQANVIKRFNYQCNNCQPSKGAPQFAVCTIRAAPSQPIHCLTYAMALYNLLFGQLDDNNILAGLLDLAHVQTCDKSDPELLKQTAIKIFNILFYDEIKKGLEGYKQDHETAAINQHKYPISYEEGIRNHTIYTTVNQTHLEEDDDKVQPFSYYVQLFVDSFVTIMQSPGLGSFKFDKDDWDSVKFVTAVTNVRTYNFGKKYKPTVEQHLQDQDKLKYLSVNEARQLGGKIIPAIASTNAIAAALQVQEAKKVLEQEWNKLKMTWIQPGFEKISPTQLSEPFETCEHCSKRNVYLHIYCDFDKTKFSFVVELAKLFGLEELEINGSMGMVYGKNNALAKRTGQNEANYDKQLLEFSQGDEMSPYASKIFSIFEHSSGKLYYWQTGCKFEFIFLHKANLEKPQISPNTRLDDIFQQIKLLKIEKRQQNAERVIELFDQYNF